MTPWITGFRATSRIALAVGLVASITAVLLSMVFYSHLLGAIGEAGWAVIGTAFGFLGNSLLSVTRAISQNPSDRTKVTEEE